MEAIQHAGRRIVALSKRETEALKATIEGKSLKAAAYEMNIKESVVGGYLRNARLKTGAKTTAELVAMAVRAGWV